MTVNTLTLADFLLARIAEDEALVESGSGAGQLLGAIADGTRMWWAGPFLHVAAARVLDECYAKRAIVQRLSVPDPHATDEGCRDCDVLYLLALPYVGHPDYRQEWRP